MFGTIMTGSSALSKLGDACREPSHAWPTPAGMVAHTSVTPEKAGAKSVAKPASSNVPGPLGSASSSSDRLPFASGGTLSGFTATQQL